MTSWVAFVFLGTLGWGISLFLIKIMLVSLTPLDIVLYRMIIGACSLIVLIKYFRIRITNYIHLMKDGFIVGMFNMAIPFYLTSYAEKHIASVLAAIMNGLTPLFTCLLSISLFATQQPFNFFHLMSIVFGMVGILMMHIESVLNTGQMKDLFALLGVSVSYAIAANYIKTVANTKEPLLLAAVAAIFTVIIMLACKLVAHEMWQWNVPVNALQVSALLWLGVIGTGFSLYLYCFIIQKLGAVVASMITYLMVITGMLTGSLLMKESITSMMFIGSFCIVMSLVFAIHQDQIIGMSVKKQLKWLHKFLRPWVK